MPLKHVCGLAREIRWIENNEWLWFTHTFYRVGISNLSGELSCIPFSPVALSRPWKVYSHQLYPAIKRLGVLLWREFPLEELHFPAFPLSLQLIDYHKMLLLGHRRPSGITCRGSAGGRGKLPVSSGFNP